MSDNERRMAELSPAKQALLRARIQRLEQESQYVRTIPRQTSRDEFPISFAQERIWLHEQLWPASVVYNRPANLRIQGPLRIDSLRKALEAIVAGHESLRTTVSPVGGIPMLRVHSHTPAEMLFTDLSIEPEPEQRMQQLARNEASRSFDLAKGPLFRCHLLRLNSQDHFLLLTFHHITFDAWSQALLLDELIRNYESSQSNKNLVGEAPVIQYPDFAVWDRSLERIAALKDGRSYWRTALERPPVLKLPTDVPRSSLSSESADHVEFELSPELVVQLRSIAKSENTMLFSVLLASFTVLLHRYTGDHDIIVGCPVAGRNRLETEPLIGVFINTLLFRTSISTGDKFRNLLQRVRDSVINGLQYQEVPLQFVVQDVLRERENSRSPLFQTMFIHERFPSKNRSAGSVIFEPREEGPAATLVDLMLELNESPNEVTGRFVYRTELWERSTIERMVKHFSIILEGINSDANQTVAELPLLTDSERHQMLVRWNDTTAEYPKDKCVHELFEEQVQRTPDSVATVLEDQELTYRTVNERANQLGRYLRSQGVAAGAMVGLCLPRSPELVVGILAILKAGAAYVPLDPTHPRERLSFIIDDSQAAMIVTDSRFVNRFDKNDVRVVCIDRIQELILAESTGNIPIQISPDEPLYVIYTSGSTGTPKGVIGLHRGAINRFSWMWRKYPFEPDEVCCLKTTISFVDSVWEILGPLLSGVRTVALSDAIVKDPSELVHSLATHRVTRIALVPSQLRVLLQSFSELRQVLPRLTTYFTSGEALSEELIQCFRQSVPDARLINLYGSSEVAADVTCCDTTEEEYLSFVSIGRPIANTQAYVLDTLRIPVPVGVVGELYIGGAGLALGYLKREDLTSDRFVANPFDNENESRLFRTGDLCRWRTNGHLEYLGRVDNQVKLRGFRIELGEVESVLNQHPGVSQSVVLLREDRPEDKRLVAYCVPSEDSLPPSSELRIHLQNRLPEVMVPAVFVSLERLPLTTSGKVDRRELPAPDDSRPELETGYVTPTNPIEQQLAIIWGNALGIDKVGIHDNFFSLGGHSLLAVEMFAQIEKSFGRRLPLAILFQHATIGHLAKVLSEPGSDSDIAIVLPLQTAGKGRPLFLMPSLGGELLFSRAVIKELGDRFPLLGIQPPMTAGNLEQFKDFRSTAGCFVDALQTYQPHGPYALAGYSYGGLMAYEVACLLTQLGETVDLLAVIDVEPGRRGLNPQFTDRLKRLARIIANLPFWLREESRQFSASDFASRVIRGLRRFSRFLASHGRSKAEFDDVFDEKRIPSQKRELMRTVFSAFRDYIPRPYPSKVTLICAKIRPLFRGSPRDLGWRRLVNALEIRRINCDHATILKPPHVGELARHLAELHDELT